ncbi:hypothetical protein VTL71DRAFT_7965 [Oculimacula yallundae]|uniref:Uncharacterized protein n=1 Tax=Oculimacula yallundae TaxID=86028 RepID=A0ABR4CWI2_9HELO
MRLIYLNPHAGPLWYLTLINLKARYRRKIVSYIPSKGSLHHPMRQRDQRMLRYAGSQMFAKYRIKAATRNHLIHSRPKETVLASSNPNAGLMQGKHSLHHDRRQNNTQRSDSNIDSTIRICRLQCSRASKAEAHFSDLSFSFIIHK